MNSTKKFAPNAKLFGGTEKEASKSYKATMQALGWGYDGCIIIDDDPTQQHVLIHKIQLEGNSPPITVKNLLRR